MARLTITRGLPASGKTTWAKKRLATDALRCARINRDDLRRAMHGGLTGENWAERQVAIAQRAAVEALLRAGVDVICDDTFLRSRAVREFAGIASGCGAEFAVEDFTAVPLEVCLSRDEKRPDGERVGADAIRAMWDRFLAGKSLPLTLPDLAGTSLPLALPDLQATDATPAMAGAYRPDAGLPEAVLVDIDGTVALIGARSPYDMTRVGEDRPNLPVIAAVRAMRASGHHIVFCSGRSDDARAATEKWLAKHVAIGYEALFMRETGDSRRDAIVKAEIFEREIRHRWRVTGVFDDRAAVVRMWRALGLTVFQVAEGNF